MVEIDPDSVIANPLNHVDDIFNRAESHLESAETDWGEDQFLREIAESVKDRLEPCGDGLVRICGMITQSKGSEFYSGVYRDPITKSTRSGKYRDTAPYEYCHDQSQRLFSREVFVVSEIPGLSSWVKCLNPFLCSEKLYLKILEKETMPRVGHLVDVIGIRSKESPSIVHQVWSQTFSLFPIPDPVSSISPVRGDLIQFIAHALGNDYTAAQYVLIHLISRVHSRVQQDNVAIGNFPLHLQPVTEEAALILHSRIVELYSLLLPFTTTFELSIENLSAYPAVNPRMDYELEELVSGPLHLAPGTVLILDQTKMESGQLEQHAVENLKMLQRLASDQVLPFNFMYNIDFEVDTPVLVIAKEKTTLVPTHYKVGIGGVDSLPEYIDYRIDDSLLESWRQYISSARQMVVQLPDHISDRAKQDFLAHRLNAQQMHRILNFVRLLSASYLESEITEAIWDSAFALEKERSCNFTI